MSRIIHISTFLLSPTVLVLLLVLVVQAQSDNFLLSVVPQRTVVEIRADLDRADQNIRSALNRFSAAKSAYTLLEARIESKKQQIHDLGVTLKTVKRSSNRVQQVSLEANRNAAKQILKLLESRKKLRATEMEAAERAKLLASASRYALEMELELSLKRLEQDSLLSQSTSALKLSAASQVVRELEGKYLEAQRVEAKKTEELAAKEKRVVEQRLDLFDLQSKVMGSER